MLLSLHLSSKLAFSIAAAASPPIVLVSCTAEKYKGAAFRTLTEKAEANLTRHLLLSSFNKLQRVRS